MHLRATQYAILPEPRLTILRRIGGWTGAFTGPELDGALPKANGIEFRVSTNGDPIASEQINRGKMEYFDLRKSEWHRKAEPRLPSSKSVSAIAYRSGCKQETNGSSASSMHLHAQFNEEKLR